MVKRRALLAPVVGLLLGVLAALNAAAAPVPGAAPATQPKIRVLILDGFSNHNWKLNTQLLRGILEPSGICAVTVSTSPPTATAPGWDSWRPDFSKADVVLQTCNDISQGPNAAKWPDEVKKGFVEFVRKGGGALVYHSGNNAFPDWPEYSTLIGLGWRKSAQGAALQVGEDEQLIVVPAGTGRDTGHAARAPVLVHQLGEHPIHAGLPRAWMSPGLEVYYNARGPADNLKNVTVLSYGRDPRFKENWPLEWVVDYGEGRVYSSTFGHVWADDVQPESVRCADEQTLLLRAIQWLAKRPVTIEVPADFPTPDKVSIRPEIVLPKE